MSSTASRRCERRLRRTDTSSSGAFFAGRHDADLAGIVGELVQTTVRILYLADIRLRSNAPGIQTMETCYALADRGHTVRLLVRPGTAGCRAPVRLLRPRTAWPRHHSTSGRKGTGDAATHGVSDPRHGRRGTVGDHTASS